MNYGQKVKKQQYREIWEEYCSFLDLSIEEYMEIQKRLLEEQISVWSASGLGQMFLKGRQPQTIEDFRRTVPLTTYGDYVGKEDGHAARGTGYLASDYMGGRQTSGQSSALHQKHAGRFPQQSDGDNYIIFQQ